MVAVPVNSQRTPYQPLDLSLMPPMNLDAEQAVLGCCLIEREAIEATMGLLDPSDFYRPAHRIIYKAILRLHEQRKPVDILTVSDLLKQFHRLEEVGGLPYLFSLHDAPTTSAIVAHYADAVASASLRRKLIEAGEKIAQMGHAQTDDVDTTINEAQALLTDIERKGLAAGVDSLASIVPEAVQTARERGQSGKMVTGIESAWGDLDYYTRGWQKGELSILAARPSMGKSLWAMQAVQAAAKDGHTCVVFSLEMHPRDLVYRMLAQMAKVNPQALSTGMLTDHQWEDVAQAAEVLADLPIYIDTVSRTAAAMRTVIRAINKWGDPVGMVMVDYLQIMTPERHTGNEASDIGQLAEALKGIARDFDTHVLALAQLSRAVEHRPDKKPVLSDLKGSGGIEQAADLVMMLYREDYYKRDKDADMDTDGLKDPFAKEKAQIIVTKHRNGPTGEINLIFDPEFVQFLAVEDRYT